MSRGRKAKLGAGLSAVGARALQHRTVTRKHFPGPPDHFDDVAVDIFWAFVDHIGEARELAVVDWGVIAQAASAFSRWLAFDRLIALKPDDEGFEGLCERLGFDPSGVSGEVGDKGFMSGLAQNRQSAAKEYRACAALLGGTPVDRIKTSGALQSSFFELLGAPAKRSSAADDPFADANVIAAEFGGS